MIFNSSSATSYFTTTGNWKENRCCYSEHGEEEARGSVEGWRLWVAVSSLCCHRENQCSGSQSSQQQMFGAGLGFVQRGCLHPLTPWRWPSLRLTFVSQASRREFLLHCALVVLGNASLKGSGSGSAVVRRSLLLLGGLGGGAGWAAGEQPLPSFLGSGWNGCGIPVSSPLADSSESGHRENKPEETTKFQWSFSSFLGFFFF